MHRHTSQQRLVRRAKIVLLANRGLNNEQIAQQLHTSRVTVQRWRQRWNQSASKLTMLSLQTNPKVLPDIISPLPVSCSVVSRGDMTRSQNSTNPSKLPLCVICTQWLYQDLTTAIE
ncbi:MAG: helix-turn-helix domain-containing protein [Coleofasciculus sp. G1-WW12-02]|uniref:helix-turn-helix domain-containing protein n=1 Tax=Coleofasciculus sp. G1-WW12-02 TaxID=3068483 RepID=UPI0032F4D49D